MQFALIGIGISNCGTSIVKSSAPSEFRRIGYFEAWNADRPCLNMRADQIPTYQYTHIHFAFPNVTEDFKIDVSGVKDQFNRFKKLKGVKKIISLGGWAFVSVLSLPSEEQALTGPEQRNRDSAYHSRRCQSEEPSNL